MSRIQKIKWVAILFIVTILNGEFLQAQIKVACVGNSITYGSGIKNREKYNYPKQLQNILGDAWLVKNFGVSGRTMLKNGDYPLWKEETFAKALRFNPDVVIIKLGTNDSKIQNWEHKSEFISDYQAMIDTFTQVSNPVIFVCLPVPIFGNRWNIDSAIVVNEVTPMIQQVAAENQLPAIDLFTPFIDKNDLFPDQIHPNAHGAAVMAGVISRYLLANSYLITERKMRKK